MLSSFFARARTSHKLSITSLHAHQTIHRRTTKATACTTAHLELVCNTRNADQRSAVVQLFAYSDAAFLTHADSKSHSGIHLTLGKETGVFHARCLKQKMVTLSSTEAEVYAVIECAKRHYILSRCSLGIGLQVAGTHHTLH